MTKDSKRTIEATSRVKAILRVLDRTPISADLLLEASQTFAAPSESGQRFTNVRRVRQKLQELAEAKLIKVQQFTLVGRGVTNFYQIAPDGYRLLYGADAPPEHRKFFRSVAPLNQEHAYANARVIVKTLVAAHRAGIQTTNFCREREITIEANGAKVQPDHFYQLKTSGKVFNLLFEVDRNTETLDSMHPKAWRQRILTYDAYQDALLVGKRRNAARRLRIVFLTSSIQHSYYFLALARDTMRNPKRVLFYAATIDAYLNDADPLRNPIFLDHFGRWQALVNVHPSSLFVRDPVRLPQQLLEPSLPF